MAGVNFDWRHIEISQWKSPDSRSLLKTYGTNRSINKEKLITTYKLFEIKWY